MKQVVFILIIGLIAFSAATAQNRPGPISALPFKASGTTQPKGVPNILDTIKQVQAAKYPTAQGLSWSVESGMYFAFFTLNGKTCTVRYDKHAEPTEVQQGIEYNALPAKARKYITANYKEYRATTVSMIYKKNPAENQEPFLKTVGSHYEVFMRKESQLYKFYFSAKGKLLNKVEMKMVRAM